METRRKGRAGYDVQSTRTRRRKKEKNETTNQTHRGKGKGTSKGKTNFERASSLVVFCFLSFGCRASSINIACTLIIWWVMPVGRSFWCTSLCAAFSGPSPASPNKPQAEEAQEGRGTKTRNPVTGSSCFCCASASCASSICVYSFLSAAS